MRALVIDDSRATRMILEQILKALKFETLSAGHGLEALEKLKEVGPIELALVDWNMPEMNGYEFVCEVRKDSTYKDMRLMMVTTETEMEQVIKALEAGADEYIMKPFTKEMIIEKLKIMDLPVE